MTETEPEERTDKMQALIAKWRAEVERHLAETPRLRGFQLSRARLWATMYRSCADELEAGLAASPASGAPTAETFCSRYGTHGWTKTPSKGDPCDCGGVRYAETDGGVFGEIGDD